MTTDKPPYCLVIGASRGLGLAILEKYSKAGRLVVGTTSQIDRVAEFSSACKVPFLHLDLRNLVSIGEACNSIIAQHGVPEHLVINSGIGTDRVLGTMSEIEIASTISVNFTGVMLCLKYLSRAMLLKRRGSIVLIGSITARTGYSGLTVYGATKGGLEGAVRGLSRELGKRGVRINIVHPGFMETDMTSNMNNELKTKIMSRSPFKRFVLPSEVAAVVEFLCSDGSSGVTGTSIVVDVGSTA